MIAIEAPKLQAIATDGFLSKGITLKTLVSIIENRACNHFSTIEWALPHALKLAGVLGNKDASVQFLIAACMGCLVESRPADALKYLRQAERYVDCDDCDYLTSIHHGRSIAQLKLGETFTALTEAELSLTYSRGSSIDRLAQATCNVGINLLELNEYSKAIEMFEKAVEHVENHSANVHIESFGTGELCLAVAFNNIAEHELRAGNSRVAATFCRRAYKLSKKALIVLKGTYSTIAKTQALYEAIRSLINFGDLERAQKLCGYLQRYTGVKHGVQNHYATAMFADIYGTLLVKSAQTQAGLTHLLNAYATSENSQSLLVNERLLRLIVQSYDDLNDSKNSSKWNQLLELKISKIERQKTAYQVYRDKQAKSPAQVGAMEFLLHDLRSPIASQLALLDGIKPVQGTLQLDESQAKEIKRLALRSLFMTQEYLTYERLNGTGAINRQHSSLYDIVSSAYSATHMSCKLAGVRLQQQEPAEDTAIFVDPVLIEKALISLINNSINASAAGSCITLQTCVKATSLEISVVDQGSGMPDYVQRSLFTPNANNHSRRGYGLGFALVRRVIELHGGQIQIQSSPKGTKIGLILPYTS
jgi:signal transduction histidine kinase